MANLRVAIFLAVIGIGSAVPNEFSHYVDLKRGLGSAAYHHCSGVIVHPEWVLTTTTGSCTARLTSVVAGDLNEEVVEGTEQTRVPGEVIKNPTYNVSLVKVSPPFQFNDNVNQAVFPDSDVVTAGNTVRAAGKNSASNGGYFQRKVLETDLTLAEPETCTFSPPPAGPGYSCVNGEGATRCAGEPGSPVQCKIETESFFCGMIINKGWCFQTGPNDVDPPAIIEEAAIHTSVIKQWVSDTIAARRG